MLVLVPLLKVPLPVANAFQDFMPILLVPSHACHVLYLHFLLSPELLSAYLVQLEIILIFLVVKAVNDARSELILPLPDLLNVHLVLLALTAMSLA